MSQATQLLDYEAPCAEGLASLQTPSLPSLARGS